MSITTNQPNSNTIGCNVLYCPTVFADSIKSYTSGGAVDIATGILRVDEVAAPTQSGTNALIYDDSTSHLLSAKVGNDTARLMALGKTTGTNIAPYFSTGTKSDDLTLQEETAPTQSGTNAILYDDSTSHLLSAKVGNNNAFLVALGKTTGTGIAPYFSTGTQSDDLTLVEEAAPSGVANKAIIYDDSTSHVLTAKVNNGPAQRVAVSGTDNNFTNQQTFSAATQQIVLGATPNLGILSYVSAASAVATTYQYNDLAGITSVVKSSPGIVKNYTNASHADLTAASAGATIFVTQDGVYTINVPDPVAGNKGVEYLFMIETTGGNIVSINTVTPNASKFIISIANGDAVTQTSKPTTGQNTVRFQATATVGDSIRLFSNGTLWIGTGVCQLHDKVTCP